MSNESHQTSDLNNLQGQIETQGEQLFQLMEGENTSIFNRDWWYGRIMDWSMKNDTFKTQMFRFVDVLPYLNSGTEVARHLKEYFTDDNNEELPSVFNFGLGLGSLAPSLLAGAVKKNVTQMARMFITGENPKDAIPTLKKSRKQNLCFTVDLLGEATVSESESLDYQKRYLELIKDLSYEARNWTDISLLDEDHLGKIPKVNVSVKMTAMYSQVNTKAWEESKKIIKDRLRPIFHLAMETNCFINIDMEQYDYKDLTLEVFKEIIDEPAFKNYPFWGIVIQAYLKDSLSDVKKLVQFAKTRSVPFTVRLVKGAYWDYETVVFKQRNWEVPVYVNKSETDLNYENCLYELLKNHSYIKTAVASHNVRSISVAMVLARQFGIPQNGLEIQMLYGMADPIKKACIKAGYRVREYATVGELIPGMAYLVRRLLENTSNESFLKSKFADNISSKELLANPASKVTAKMDDHTINDSGFINEPLLDFSIEKNRSKLISEIEKLKQNNLKTYPLVIDNQKITTQTEIVSINPSHPDQIIGKVHAADIKEAQMSINGAKNAFSKWKKVNYLERAQIVEKLADLIVRDRFKLTALEVLEVGKTWSEADGDIVEAVDFCRYYANHMKSLGKEKRVGHAPGELSHYQYIPRGVTAVIAPWNFPLAILTGMVTAAMVTGNTVIMKPAEQSSLIAAQLMELLIEAGTPPGVVQFLPGYGEVVGEYLTSNKDVHIIAFTGSKDVGINILNKSSKLSPNQTHLKKCIIEMGGKNAVIVDSDADLDEAIHGIIYSAFGFQGQKCSACSRVIVLNEIYPRFIDRLIEATKSIYVGFAENPNSYLGPVIDSESQNRILQMIERAKKYAKLAYQGDSPAEGWFVPPTIFTEVDPKSEIAQEEIFGPVLSVIKVQTIDDAIQIANDTAYGLTGGVYSRSPANIEKVKSDFMVGNFYINRGITGAMVDRHPFGGFKLSGVGSKTGGPDYLLQFVEPRVVTENTMRRGFAPKESSDT